MNKKVLGLVFSALVLTGCTSSGELTEETADSSGGFLETIANKFTTADDSDLELKALGDTYVNEFGGITELAKYATKPVTVTLSEDVTLTITEAKLLHFYDIPEDVLEDAHAKYHATGESFYTILVTYSVTNDSDSEFVGEDISSFTLDSGEVIPVATQKSAGKLAANSSATNRYFTSALADDLFNGVSFEYPGVGPISVVFD